MKVAVLLVVACLAVATAAKFDTEALAYCSFTSTLLCAAGNGSSCATTISGTDVTARFCPSGTYATSSGAANCLCLAYETVTLGATCTNGQKAVGFTCAQKTQNPSPGDTAWYWFAARTEGDTCDASTAFGCTPSSRCVNGKCVGQLLTGEVCHNATASLYLNYQCGVKDYCPGSGDVRVCTARLAADANCTDAIYTGATPAGAPCPSYQVCTAVEGNGKWCKTPAKYWIPAGQKYNTSASDCASNMVDINGICKDYDTVYNAWLPKKGISCDTATTCEDANGYGDCECTATGTSAASSCYWDQKTTAELRAAYDAEIAKKKKYYDAACALDVTPPSDSSVYCQVALGYYTAVSYGPCNSAFSGRAFSAVTMVLSAIVAVFLAKW